MKIFNDVTKWVGKVNFVDENNVLVGYDMTQDCCEFADWFISDDICDYIPKELDQPNEMDGYVFDRDFFEERYNSREFDEGGVAIFKLIHGFDVKYLHIFNSHNGYYGHGFTFKEGNEIIQEGCL